MVDCETNEPSIKPFTVPRNWRGQLDVEAIEKSLAASQHILEGIVHGNRHGYPACRDGWTCTSYTGTPIQIQVAPKPGKRLQYAMCIVCRLVLWDAFLEPLCFLLVLWLAQLKLFLRFSCIMTGTILVAPSQVLNPNKHWPIPHNTAF